MRRNWGGARASQSESRRRMNHNRKQPTHEWRVFNGEMWLLTMTQFKEMKNKNTTKWCRSEHHNVILAHCMASADWLITFHGVPSSKLCRMWSVLNLDVELEILKSSKTRETISTEMKLSSDMQKKAQKVKVTTPVKTPKTRMQKRAHVKVSTLAMKSISKTFLKVERWMLRWRAGY